MEPRRGPRNIERPDNDMKEMTMTTYNDRISAATTTLITIALVALVSFGVSASMTPLVI